MSHEVEISSWADIKHTPTLRPPGGFYTATDKESGEFIGELSYYYDLDTIMFRNVKVDEKYRRRRVATALLRYLNLENPDHRINPGTRNEAGDAFMKHILANEKEKVATNGVLHVPLSTMLPPGFRPHDYRMASQS